MEGPTPVSALIHAATMVTAGVYMIGRNAVLFSHAPQTLAIVAVVGAATALMAGTIGLVQNDIKRVLAYSTVSQLGYMFLAMGVGAFARRHLPSLHARVLQGAAVPRVGRGHSRARTASRTCGSMGGLKKELPITYWTFLIGALAIAGVPRLAGLLQQGRDPLPRRSRAATRCCGSSALLTSLLTAIYMFRLVFLAFHGERRDGSLRARRRTAARTRAGTRHGQARLGTCTTRRRRWRSRSSCWRSGRSLAGYVGVPHALGGGEPHRARSSSRASQAAGGAPVAAGELAALAAEPAAAAEAATPALELTLMVRVDRSSRSPASASRRSSS